MKTRADLIMPKLGLTMTEGTVAQWVVAPGASFGADDLVAVIETDKIAYEVRAPSAGTLAKILVPTGTAVAVGTPIAQWELKDVPARDVPPVATAEPSGTIAAAPNDMVLRSAPVAMPSLSNRIIATPYARRIARKAGIDLATVTAANNRRIRADDVERAIARRTVGAQTATRPGTLTAGFTMVGTEVSADRLVRVITDIADGVPELQPAPCHFVVLAAARALVEHGVAPVIGLQHGDSAPHIIDTEACRSLSAIVAADRAGGVPGASMMLLVADHTDKTLVVSMPSSDCGVTLGVGAINRVFRPDAVDAPVLCAEFHLAFGRRNNDALPGGLAVLDRIRALLENPFVLLAI